MHQLILDELLVTFTPPPWEKPKRGKREVHLMGVNGVIFAGPVIHSLPGRRKTVEVPEQLTVIYPEAQRGDRYPLSELNREILRRKITDELHLLQRSSSSLPRRPRQECSRFLH